MCKRGDWIVFLIAMVVVTIPYAIGASPLVPVSVQDGQCFTIDENIPAPSNHCDEEIFGVEEEQVVPDRTRRSSVPQSPSGSGPDWIMGSDDQESEEHVEPVQESDDPRLTQANASRSRIFALPNGDHLWAALEYMQTRAGLFPPSDCELVEAFVTVSSIEEMVDKMRIGAGGAVELLPRSVSMGEDYVAMAVDHEANVMLAVDAGFWQSSLVMFSCPRP